MNNKQLILINHLIEKLQKDSENQFGFLKNCYEKINTMEESERLEYAKDTLEMSLKFLVNNWGKVIEIEKIIQNEEAK